jgi:hypothetical protein
MKFNRLLTIAALAMALTSTSAWSAQQPVVSTSLSVNQLAAKPDVYVGKVAVVGRVAAAKPGKGFTLIDSINCATCTSECLTDKTTKKIPFLWSGAAPMVKDIVRVDGTLTKTSRGYTFTAERVTKQ